MHRDPRLLPPPGQQVWKTRGGRSPPRQRSIQSSELSREHAIHTSERGVITAVGGKLTTYRQMAEETVAATGLAVGPCRTRDLPLLGAAPRQELAQLTEPERLVRRFGTEARLVIDNAITATGLTKSELIVPGPGGVTLAELVFGVTHEGALNVDDLLDRRTRVGLVPQDRDAALPLAERALALTGHEDRTGTQ